MTFLQLKKIFKEELQGKYVLFGDPSDPASTNTYWMRMNGIQGVNVVGGHEKDDTTVARKLEMLMQKIQSKSFTVYDDEISVRKAAEKNQEKKAFEADTAEVIYDGTDVQESPTAPALDEIENHKRGEEPDMRLDDQELNFEDFVIEKKENQDQSATNDVQSTVHQESTVDDIFEGFESNENLKKDTKTDEGGHTRSHHIEDPHSEDENERTDQREKENGKEDHHLISGLQKRGVHVGKVNPNFHATPPKHKKEREEEKKDEEDHVQKEKDQKQQKENVRKQKEKQKRQEERELVEQEERQKSQHKDRKAVQKEQEIKEKKESKGLKKLDDGVEDIFESFTSDHSKIHPIERYDQVSNNKKETTHLKEASAQNNKKRHEQAQNPSAPVKQSVPIEPNIPVVSVLNDQVNSAFTKGESASGELPLLEAIELFWKDPHHTKSTNTKDFIIDVEKFSDQYFSHFSDEKMRIMYGWQTLRESASESFHISPTFSECESKFGPKALDQYIHSLPNR